MTSSISIPANFGVQLMGLKSNNVTLKTEDGPVIASSVVLALNSPVIKEQILNEAGDETTLDFEGYSTESVKVFLRACYQGRLDLDRENMSHIHKMSHKFQVFWMAEEVLEDFKNRVRRCAEKTYNFETALFLFKEAVSSLIFLKKRSFVDVFIQCFAAVPKRRNGFLELYLKNMHNYSAEELKIAAEMSGGRVDIVVNALANHIFEFKTLDMNARGLLKSINFQYLKQQHEAAYKVLEDVLLKNRNKMNIDDLRLILVLTTNYPVPDECAHPVAWNRNTTLSNLFQRRLSDDEFGDACDKSLASLNINETDTDNNSRCETGTCTSISASVCSSSSDTAYHSANEYLEVGEEEENEDGSQESEDSQDSSNADTEDTARFKERIMKLKASESTSNLYMMIEDLWDWILSQGNAKLDIEFSDLMPSIECIKTQRGWFKISSKFMDCIGNINENENVETFREAVKNCPSLFSKVEGEAVDSRNDYNLKTLFRDSKTEGKIAFDFQHKDVKDCKIKGFCGFLFKLSLGPTDDLKIELGYSESDYKDLNLHFHDNLMFAQRMHVMITGYKGKHWSLPLSWEEKPTFDENKNMVSWGRHQFPLEVRADSSPNAGTESSSSTSSQTNEDPGSSSSTASPTKVDPSSPSNQTKSDLSNSLHNQTEGDSSEWVYQWGVADEVRLRVYYCTE
ncbi:hypothetical protein ACHWQZ_G009530 [Mnemiopsis leidyi]